MIEMSMVAASRLKSANFRLDAPAFLSQDKHSASIPSSIQTDPLSTFANVFTVYLQSPILAYVKPFEESRPYLTTSELAEYQNGRVTHVSLLADPRLLGWEIRRGNVVVSRSGRVGEAYWVDKKLNGALVGDSFRVVLKKPEDGPFIYAVLASSFARNLLSGSAYGSVVDHASVEQLRSFPVPHIESACKARISSIIARAMDLREAAYDLLDQAEQRLYEVNGLQPLESTNANDVTAYRATNRDIVDASRGASEFRLEAHFHNPIARSAISKLAQSRSSKGTVGDVARDVILCGRFTRNYVEAAYGTPFLSGRNIVQIRPIDLNYLSNSETEDLESNLLSPGWVLVTRSGTIGRTCFVWKNFENFAASEHVLRILPDDSKIDGGYLYAFLSSEYGYQQIIRFRFGSVIDEITDQQLKKVIVPLPAPAMQRQIGDGVRQAYEKRAEAIQLEAEAQQVLLNSIQGSTQREPGDV